MVTRKSGGITSALAAVIAASAVAASGATVTLAPPSGTSTNVLALYAGETSVEIAGPGTVSLNPANTYTGGTTLSGGTLAYSGTYHDGVSPLGSGTLSITSADAIVSGSGTIANNISATQIANFAPEGTIALSGNNVFSSKDSHIYVFQNTLEVTGGETRSSGALYLAYPEGKTTGTAHFRQSGGSVTLGANVQLAAIQGTTSSFTMTGGSFDVGGNNVLMFGSTGNGTSHSTIDISGDAVLSNIGSLYVHNNNPTSADLSANIHDGGRLGFKQARHSRTSARATVRLSVDGGTLANDCSDKSATKATLNDWISTKGVASVKVGPKGATFTTDNGAKAGTAQIACAITAEAAEAGETAKGLTFDSGCWEFTAAGNAYEGPTVIKNGAVLFLDANGTIPSTSTVTVGSGSELCAGGGNKIVTDLVLEKDAILGFGTSSSTPYTLTVTGSLALPAYAKIALYDSNAPVTTAVTADGTYAVLKVPASCAAALAAVRWTCATATSGKSYTFSVTTSGDTATLSMTMAADSSGAITETSNLTADDYPVDSNITINNSGTLVAKKNIYGSATGGSITINNGGTLDVSAGTIRPVDASGNSFHLYLNDGGALVARSIEGNSSLATTTPMFHFNGGTIYPVGLNTSDGNRFYLNYQPAIVGAHGLFIDMSKWVRPEGYDSWVRASVQSNVNHDPDCAGADGGITVKATGDDKAVVYFGGRFAGSDLNGGILAEKGAIVSAYTTAFEGQTVALASGSRFRPYDNDTVKIGNLTIGANGASEAVRLDFPANSVSAPGVVVSGTLSVLSPVEISFCTGWNKAAAVNAGVSTAMVFKAESPIDTSLFRLPASATSYSLSAETVALTEGDYADYTALVLTVTGDDSADLRLATDGTNVTLSADATYNNIYVGDIEGSGPKSLTVTGGEIAAQYLYIANLPVDGDSVADKHTCTYTQSGGKVSVTSLSSSVNTNNPATGRANSEITLNGGTLEVAEYVRFGQNRQRRGCTSTLTINDGAAMAVGGKMWLTYYNYNDNDALRGAAQGIVNMNGGTLSVGGDIDLSRCEFHPDFAADGGIFLKGGVLSAPNIVQTAANNPYQRLVFDGGVFAPNAAAANRTLTGLAVANIAAGGAIIDTSALPAGGAYTIAQNLLKDPALDGAADGGFTKRGAGTLVLSGANTFTGPTRVEGGLLSITSGDAVSSYIAVSDGAALDLGGVSVSVGKIAASGLVRNGSLTVTGAIAANDAGSILSVDGDLTLAARSAVDFGGCAAVPTGWTPVAAASGTVTVPDSLRARNAGKFTRCETQLIDGVLYVKPYTSGMIISIW